MVRTKKFSSYKIRLSMKKNYCVNNKILPFYMSFLRSFLSNITTLHTSRNFVRSQRTCLDPSWSQLPLKLLLYVFRSPSGTIDAIFNLNPAAIFINLYRSTSFKPTLKALPCLHLCPPLTLSLDRYDEFLWSSAGLGSR